MNNVAKLYEQDFHAWTQENARLLKEGRLGDVDVEHLVEEIEGMGAGERRAMVSRLEVLLVHLLKWQFQPERRGHSWELSIVEQREKLLDLLSDNPSLNSPQNLGTAISKAYKYAVLGAQRETGLSRATFPDFCPYSWEQIADGDFYPG